MLPSSPHLEEAFELQVAQRSTNEPPSTVACTQQFAIRAVANRQVGHLLPSTSPTDQIIDRVTTVDD